MRRDHAALSQPVPAGDYLARFDRGILLRGVNALKSARLLLEAMHWEFAAGPARCRMSSSRVHSVISTSRIPFSVLASRTPNLARARSTRGQIRSHSSETLKPAMASAAPSDAPIAPRVRVELAGGVE
jgi:hypothetical protein